MTSAKAARGQSIALGELSAEKRKMVAKTNHFFGVLAAVARATLAAMGLLVLMVAVAARPAEAAFPGKNGKKIA